MKEELKLHLSPGVDSAEFVRPLHGKVARELDRAGVSIAPEELSPQPPKTPENLIPWMVKTEEEPDLSSVGREERRQEKDEDCSGQYAALVRERLIKKYPKQTVGEN